MLLFSASFFTLAPELRGLRVKEETENSARKPPLWRLFSYMDSEY
ncbi:pheST operon leader peptide PheM [Klebsiella pneumoniae]|uniref:PheST operon leader peptide PheM n=1 Tax=Klebsiella pneumoniae TaxID=573 RepID=A0A5C2LGQ1_KLEPN|nr:pheST operon leader peptide PheM [Klebsiella pneumoniae]RRE54641.1 pheST operon leader peptide PheM [Klebsiella pneumoniae]